METNKSNAFKLGFLPGASLKASSAFGYRILNGKKGFHKGIDIAVPVGTPLSSPFNGRIEQAVKIENPTSEAQLKKGYGRWIQLSAVVPGGNIKIRFGHLEKVSVDLNQTVTAGQSLGVTGNTGYSTGPHIHIEVIQNGNNVDPLPFLCNYTIFGVVNQLPKTFSADDVVNRSGVSSDDIKTVDASSTEYIPDKETNTNMTVQSRLAPGIWRIVKLLIDDSVANKQVADSSISVQTGSLLNFFRKVCQEPWVEFFGDTYGDMFYYIVRKPPFDKEALTRMLDTVTPQLINQEDIITTNLGWNDQNIYSWFQLLPVGDFLGSKELTSYMPAIYFPEYAAVWGSKPLAIQSNYYNFIQSGRFNNDKDENAANQNNILSNAVADLRYLVESNMYNPFTRRGTITINGTRKIKRGTFIMHTSGEIFHVDSVTNNYQVTNNSASYSTTLQVSKGLYPNFIKGQTINGKLYSYFNVINFGDGDSGGSKTTPGNAKTDSVNQENWLTKLANWKVDQDVFAFFMRKEQVVRSQNSTI